MRLMLLGTERAVSEPAGGPRRRDVTRTSSPGDLDSNGSDW